MKYWIFLFCSLISLGLIAQDDEEFVNVNRIHVENLTTVKLTVDGMPMSLPIIDLNSRTQLLLSFDDLDGGTMDYIYKVIHCNHDWQPSDLSDLEYIDGFTEGDIDNFNFSFRTLSDFTNYTLKLPNQDMKFNKSGNYILQVYEDDGDRTLVITRRFMISETEMRIAPKMTLPMSIGSNRSLQEIDFTVTPIGFEVRNPLVEVHANILQNGRWDNALLGFKPIYTRKEDLVFDYLNKITFQSGKEWRFVDLRSFEYPNDRKMIQVEEFDDGYAVTLSADRKRANQAYLSFNDINGQFVVENLEEFIRGAGVQTPIDTSSAEWQGLRENQRQAEIAFIENTYQSRRAKEREKQRLVSDYAIVHFALESPAEIYDKEVYIYGELTDWDIREENRMTYNEKEKMYEGKALLKQGYYNYLYAVVDPKDRSKIDLEEIEGSWFETENQYTILVYYRPFGSRYDKLVAVQSFSSNM